jgi:hypothetical protein
MTDPARLNSVPKMMLSVYETRPLDPRWTLPSFAEKNPLVWMAEVNGLLVDLRCMPHDLQEIAFAKGLILYIPADRKERSSERNGR